MDIGIFLRDDFSSWFMQKALPNSDTLPQGHPALRNNDWTWKCKLKGSNHGTQNEVSLWTSKRSIPTRANKQQVVNIRSRTVRAQSTTETCSNQKQQQEWVAVKNRNVFSAGSWKVKWLPFGFSKRHGSWIIKEENLKKEKLSFLIYSDVIAWVINLTKKKMWLFSDRTQNIVEFTYNIQVRGTKVWINVDVANKGG